MSQILKRQNTKSKSTQQTPDGIELQDLWNRLESKGMFQRDAVSLSFLLPGMGSFLLMAKAEGKKQNHILGFIPSKFPIQGQMLVVHLNPFLL